MINKTNEVEKFLNSTRTFFNANALEGKSRELQETIVWHWVRFIEHTFFLRYIDQFSSSFYNLLGKSQRSPDEIIQTEIDYLKEANDFLNKLINFSPKGKEENSKQRWFNLLMLNFLEKVLDRSHNFFVEKHYKNKSLYEEKYISRDFLFEYNPRKKLLYSASPKYLINGFKLLKDKGRIEIDSIDNFVYSNFDFYSNKGYSIPPHKEDYSLKWLGVKGSFPQLLGQLKETKNILATHEEIADFVLQYVKMQRSSALQYASLKEKLSKKNTIDIQDFRR